MVVLGRVVFIASFVALGGAVAAANAEAVGGPSGPGGVMMAIASRPGLPVSDSEPREAEDSAQPPAGGDSKALKSEPRSPEQTRRQKLDDLFTRLAASTDVAETNGLVLAIDRLQLESGSNTGDYLMTRAIAAIETRNFETSLALLDKIIILQPDWAEAWNKRATARYLVGDDQGSMTDIAHVLILEPRHLGALSGMGMILERRGFRDDALRAYRRALDVAPQLSSLRSAVERLKAAVAGQGL
jgi:tetratricopeptide (TPR) repeat protein